MTDIITPSGEQPAAAVPPAEPPYHMYEVRFLEDSKGRRIEFRQLVPGSPDPGKEHFAELIGQTTVLMTMNMPGAPPVERRLPVQFPIPMVGEGGEAIRTAFKVFDRLAEVAQKDAIKRLEGEIAERQRQAASAIVVPVPGTPLPNAPITMR